MILNRLQGHFKVVLPNKNIFRMIISLLMKSFTLLRGREKRSISFKLDMSRTYDKMEQDFDNETLYAFGFDENFIWIIWECNLSVSYSISLNGFPFVEVPIQEVQKRKTSISFSFYHGVEVLSRMLVKVENDRIIHGVKVGRGAPSILHLLFS